jgi:NAD dependent epimerase/dehydratase family enzyme
MKELRHAVHRTAFDRVPRTAVRIAFGEMSAIVMASQRGLPHIAGRSGHAFKHTELTGALAAVMTTPCRRQGDPA